MQLFKKPDASPNPAAPGAPADSNSPNPSPAPTRRRLSLHELPMLPWGKSNAKGTPQKEKLRVIKGVFNVDTTTLKPADQIVDEIVRVLTETGISFKQKGYPLIFILSMKVYVTSQDILSDASKSNHWIRPNELILNLKSAKFKDST